MRPLYETEVNLEKERDLALFFENLYECKLRKLPIRYHLDYAVEREGRIQAFIEIKTTKYTVDQHQSHGGFKLSFAKWMAAEQMSRVAGVTFLLLVGFPDGPRYLRVDQFKHDGLAWWGRQDRGDSQDMEPAVVLSMDRFVMVR